MTLRFGLKESTIQEICAVFARYPQVAQAVLYGSRARGDYQHGSDIDVTLQGGSDLTLSVLYKIMDELDDLLLPYTLDISIFSSIADPDLVAHIAGCGVTLYERSAIRLGVGEEDKALSRS